MGKWFDYYKEINRFNFATVHQYLSWQQEYINKIIKYGGNGILLDIGTGTGIIPLYLAWLDYNIITIDKELDLLKEAKEMSKYYGATKNNPHFKGKLTLINMDMFNLGFKNKKFDLVLHSGVLEHYNENQIIYAIKEQLRVAKRVILSVPSDKYKGKSFGDENFWPIKKWEKILKEFKIIEKLAYGHVVPPFKYRIIKLMTVVNKKLRNRLLDSYAMYIGFVIE